ncbi:melanoma-associated antigen 10-like [Cavia porcellus]|uniref:melanoma-associated antigen 10-like n=1 Tax=Cavia porcellus TaxID=10141 RepID=UPI0003512023|nr:melanoma-associated antigen 10-like [Cavia porcellus]
MPRGQRRQKRKLSRGRSGPRSARELRDEKKAAATASSVSSSSCSVAEATAREEPERGASSCPQNAQAISPPPAAMASSESSECRAGSSRQGAEAPGPSQGREAPQVTQPVFPNDKLDKILRFLLQKYQNKEQITEEEMLHILGGDCQDHFPLILTELCECMRMGFGIIMREVSPPGHTYEFIPVLGLTYSGMLDVDDLIIPKADLLILILSIIFLKSNRITEEHLREMLRNKNILVESDQVVFGEPWKFITEDLVREGYLVHQRILNSNPARYEFLWGPRAHAETDPMKILEHVFALDGLDPGSCPHLCEQGLRE